MKIFLPKRLAELIAAEFEIKILLVGAFLVAFGGFMITPIQAIFLKDHLNLSVTVTSWVMAVSTFLQFGGGVVGGYFAEKFGFKNAMTAALLIRTMGLLIMAMLNTLPAVVVLALFVVAFAPALYLPANRGYVAQAVPQSSKTFFVSINNATLNAGMALGPFVATFLIQKHPQQLFLWVASIFGLNFLIHCFYLPKDTKPLENHKKFRIYEFLKVVKSIKRVFFFNTFIFYTYFFFQNFLALYLAEKKMLTFLPGLMMLNFLLLFFIQPLISSFISNWSYLKTCGLGWTLMAAGFAILSISGLPPVAWYLGIGTMTVGQSFLFLKGDLEMVDSLPNSPAMAFGIQRLSTGAGGLVSSVVGGYLLDYATRLSFLEYFWRFASLQCVFAILLIRVAYFNNTHSKIVVGKNVSE